MDRAPASLKMATSTRVSCDTAFSMARALSNGLMEPFTRASSVKTKLLAKATTLGLMEAPTRDKF